MSMLVAFPVAPLGVDDGRSEIIAEAVRVVRQSGLANTTGPMSTVIEGETWDEVMTVVQHAVEAVATRAPRVSVLIDADWRPGAEHEMTRKVTAVERHLAEPPTEV